MKIAMIGDGGHSKVIQEIILENENNKIVGFLDDHYVYIAFKENQFFGPVSTADKIIKLYHDLKFVVAIGNNAIRKSIVQKLGLMNNDYVTIIHKTAVISPSAVIGHGTVVMANAVINARAKIGNHCIINTSAVVEHDNAIGDYVHISPNATITGTVKVGEGCQIGRRAIVIPDTTID